MLPTRGLSGRRLATAVAGGVVAALAIGLTMASGERQRQERTALPFRATVWGAGALEGQHWMLKPGARSVGLIAAAARCDDEIFLVDTAARAVHRFSLVDGRYLESLGPHADGTSDLGFPRGLALDCARRTLHVVDHGVARFDLDTRRLTGRLAPPESFVEGLGHAVIDGDRWLYVPGLWAATRHDWLDKSLSDMFRSDRLGWRVDLTTGASAPMFAALEHGCASAVPDCLTVKMDRAQSPRSEAWVAAHAVSGRVGVFDQAYRLVRTIDVRSPFFFEDGTAVARRTAAIDEQMAWAETNSIIRGLYVFSDLVVTIHTVQATKNWKRGQPIDFEVFMNIHSLLGEGLVGDIRLPGLPVGRDDDHLYVIDYGAGGRRRWGVGSLMLIAIPVAQNRGLFQ